MIGAVVAVVAAGLLVPTLRGAGPAHPAAAVDTAAPASDPGPPAAAGGPGQTDPAAGPDLGPLASSTAMLRGLSFVERYAWFSLSTPDEGGDGTGLYRPDGTRTPAGTAYRAAS